MKEIGFPPEEEWNFTTIQPNELRAAAVWEYSRTALLKKAMCFLSTNFSWTFDPMADPSVFWGTTTAGASDNRNEEILNQTGNAKVSDTLAMMRQEEKFAIPDEVMDRLAEICPDEILFTPVNGFLRIAPDFGVPWRRLPDTLKVSLINYVRDYFETPAALALPNHLRVKTFTVDVSINLSARKKSILKSVWNIVKTAQKQQSNRKKNCRVRSPEILLTELSAFRLNKSKIGYKHIKTELIKMRSRGPVSAENPRLPIYPEQQEWSRAVRKAHRLLSDLKGIEYSLFRHPA